jgi:hypothetical protein
MTAVVDVPVPPVKPGHDEDHYTYPLTGEPVVRVSKILSATESEAYLAPWYATKGGTYAVDHLDELTALLRQEDGRRKAIELIAGQAKAITGIKRDTGTYVHDVVERLIIWQAARGAAGAMVTLPDLPEHLRGEEYDGVPLEKVADEMTTGFLNFCSDWDPEFLAAEMTVFNMGLGVAGTLDMIILLRNVAISADGTRLVPAPGKTLILCVDTKTGRYYKKRFRKQLAAYRKMTEALVPLHGLIPMPRTGAGAILHLRPSYRRGYRLMLVSGAAEAAAWEQFRDRCKIYFADQAEPEKPGKVVYPPRPDGTMPEPLVADLDGEGYGRIIGPLTAALGDDATVADIASFTQVQIRRQARGIGDAAIGTVAKMLADHGHSFASPGPHSLLTDVDCEGYGRIIRPVTRALGANATLADLAGMTEAQFRAQVAGVGIKNLPIVRRLLADHGLSFAAGIPAKAA